MDFSTVKNFIKGDKVIWMIFFLLCVVSVIEVFSASSSLSHGGEQYLSPISKHIGILMFGVAGLLVMANIKCKYFKVFTPFMLLVSYALLFWALIVGESTNGAQRWVSILGIQFQPSEIAKGTLVLFSAQVLSALQTPKGADPKAMKYILGFSAIPLALIFKENLSTAALLFATLVMMMFIARVPLKNIGYLLGVIILGASIFVGAILLFGETTTDKSAEQLTKTELVDKASDGKTTSADATTENAEAKPVKKGGIGSVLTRLGTWKSRIMSFTDPKPSPDEYDLDKNMQAGHANIAIAKCNVIGRGPGNSVERDFLPQAFSDFIFSIIIEEFGIIGGFLVAALYIFLLVRTGRIAYRCENNFPAFLAMGLAILLVIQALFNMAVCVGIVPVTGQPLPLVSKGGTSSIINCLYIGIILSISRTAKVKPELRKGRGQKVEAIPVEA